MHAQTFFLALKYILAEEIAEELHYLSQQEAGNIIVSKGIKATASLLLRGEFIHRQPLSLLNEQLMKYFTENRISKWRSLNCRLTGVFRKQVRLSTVERASVHMVARLTKDQ